MVGNARGPSRLTLGALVVVGLVFGHALTYVLAIGEVAHRREHLMNAGHSYLPFAFWLAAAAGVACAAAVLLGATRRRDGGEPLIGSVMRTGAVAAALQVAGFLLLETVERVLAGTPVADMLSHDVVLLGIVVQVVVAFGAAALLRGLVRAARLFAAALSPPNAGTNGALFASSPSQIIATRLLVGSRSVRGPPPTSA